jgi:hypothetical protein
VAKFTVQNLDDGRQNSARTSVAKANVQKRIDEKIFAKKKPVMHTR